MQNCKVVRDASIDASFRWTKQTLDTGRISSEFSTLCRATRSKLPLESYLNAHKSLAFVRCNWLLFAFQISSPVPRIDVSRLWETRQLKRSPIYPNDFVIRSLFQLSVQRLLQARRREKSWLRDEENHIPTTKISFNLTFYQLFILIHFFIKVEIFLEMERIFLVLLGKKGKKTTRTKWIKCP